MRPFIPFLLLSSWAVARASAVASGFFKDLLYDSNPGSRPQSRCRRRHFLLSRGSTGLLNAHVRMTLTIFLLILGSPAISLCQLPSSRCDTVSVADCGFFTNGDSAGAPASLAASPWSARGDVAFPNNSSAAFLVTPGKAPKQGFHWGRALLESFVFLSIEQAYVVHDDYRWVVVENGVPFNHYWRDYKQSLSSWVHSGWNDGDPALYSYVGHPIQGALTEYIQIQNDPQGEKLELSNTKAYWHSRLRAFLWNAVYSTQWNIGPLSELTVEKYGAKVRPSWNRDGSWPCTHKPCFTGVGQVDLVTTPIGGTGWLLAEDFLDKTIARRVEAHTRNRFLINVTRCALNPVRGGANILHGHRPWYRASRDADEVYFSYQSRKHSPPITDINIGQIQ
jgi:hypothetical protein